MWYHIHVSLARRMLRQEDSKFQTSRAYIVRIYLKNIKGERERGNKGRRRGKGRRKMGGRKGWRNFEC